MRWLGVKSQGSAIPTALQLLRLVYLGRMCLAIAIYVTAALKIRVAAPLDILVTSLMLVTAATVTLASYWHTHFRRRLPGPTFLYLQALFDVFLITAVVHMKTARTAATSNQSQRVPRACERVPMTANPNAPKIIQTEAFRSLTAAACSVSLIPGLDARNPG